jgi:hypothetical protein
VASLEIGTASHSQYAAQVIPGLLQTEEYAREVLRSIRLDATPDIERRLRLRIKRQALLTEQKAPQFWVVLDEAVLRRRVGGRQVMHRQLERLIDASALRSVTLQVIPFASGAHAAMDGEFTILNYPEPADPDVVFIENTDGDVYLEDPAVTRRYTSIFDHLRAAALDPAESIRTLAAIKDEL